VCAFIGTLEWVRLCITQVKYENSFCHRPAYAMSAEQRGWTRSAPLFCIGPVLLRQSWWCSALLVPKANCLSLEQWGNAENTILYRVVSSQCYSSLGAVLEGTDQCQDFALCTFCFLVPLLLFSLVPFPFLSHHINTHILGLVMKCKGCLLGQKELE